MRYLINTRNVESVKEEDGIVFLSMPFHLDKSEDSVIVEEMDFNGAEHHVRLLKAHRGEQTVQSLLIAKVFDLTSGKHIRVAAPDSKTLCLEFIGV